MALAAKAGFGVFPFERGGAEFPGAETVSAGEGLGDAAGDGGEFVAGVFEEADAFGESPAGANGLGLFLFERGDVVEALLIVGLFLLKEGIPAAKVISRGVQPLEEHRLDEERDKQDRDENER
jgi:hypothetical protein